MTCFKSYNQSKNWIKSFLVFSLGVMLSGCACLKTPEPEKETIDPYEPVNRAIFKFNKHADTYVIKPVATGYTKALPDTVRSRVTYFFDNLRDVTTSVNDILQGKFKSFAHDGSRLLINSTLGILGTFDPATHLGLEKRKEDFGQTLAVWGYENSAYLVLPILGPCTVRDTAGLAVDYYGLSVWPFVESDKTRIALTTLDLLDIRAQQLKNEDIIKSVSVDEYKFYRDAYLQRRKYLISDGQVPESLPENSKSDGFPGEGDNQEIVQ
jgi:phospholipid-binding lipoprotein MlaA